MCTHAFLFALYVTDSLLGLSLLKHRGCQDFPITRDFSFSPVALAASATVKRSFDLSPPAQS